MIFIGVVSNGLNSIHGSHNLGKRSFCSLININIPPLLNRSSPCAWICSSRFVSLSLCDSLALAIEALVWPTLGIPSLNPSLCNDPPSLLSFALCYHQVSSLTGFYSHWRLEGQHPRKNTARPTPFNPMRAIRNEI